MKVGVIDIGTLKVKLQIADISPSGQFETTYQSNTLTRLGAQMVDNKPVTEYLRDTIKELKRCQKVLEAQDIKKIRVVSTHALREMGQTGLDIIATIKKKTGFEVEIISQEEEANLFFQAVIKDFKTNQDFTIVDVGGGSVQVLIGNKNELKHVALLKTGAAYLGDRFSPRHEASDNPTREEIRQMQEYIMEQLAEIPAGIKTPVIYGSSCIIDVFKSMKVKLEDYSDSPTHPYKTSVKELETFLDQVIPMPYQERADKYPLYLNNVGQKYYMWGIDKALLNILSICQKEQSPYVIPTNANINNGLILSLK